MTNKKDFSEQKPNSDMESLKKKQKNLMALLSTEITKLKQIAGKQSNTLHINELNEHLSTDIIDPELLDSLMLELEKSSIEIKYPSSLKNGILENKGTEEENLFTSEDDDTEEEETELKLRSNDPVRLYLRKMGGVSLLDRKGEVDIARRIEKGEREIIHAILMCPMGTNEVIRLGEHLKKGRLKVKSIFRGLEDEDHKYNEKEYVDKIFELIGHVKKYQKKSKKHFISIRDKTEPLEKVEKALLALNNELIKKFKSVNFNRKIINRFVIKFHNLLNRMEELQKRIDSAVEKTFSQ